MNKKICFTVIVLLSAVLFLLFMYKNIFFNDQLKLVEAINNTRSVAVLYALDTNKVNSAKKILKYDVVQLIHDYDKKLYSRSKVLSSICKNWQMYTKKVVSRYLDDNETKAYSDIDFYNKVKLNVGIIDDECKNVFFEKY